jgi:hypothetical protein
MKKRILLVLGLVLLGLLPATAALGAGKHSDWSESHYGVQYQYYQNSWCTDYDCVRFRNNNSYRVKVDYTTNNAPNTTYTVYLNASETSQFASMSGQGDRLKTMVVTRL